MCVCVRGVCKEGGVRVFVCVCMYGRKGWLGVWFYVCACVSIGVCVCGYVFSCKSWQVCLEKIVIFAFLVAMAINQCSEIRLLIFKCLISLFTLIFHIFRREHKKRKKYEFAIAHKHKHMLI